MKVIFMGTPAIAATVLQSLLETDADVVLAVTQPDKKTGRKQKLVPSPVKELALKHNIPVFQPEKIRQDHQTIADLKPDLIVTCAYGQIVPQSVLDIPPYGCVNLHGSLLPRYRGGAPIQRAIWNGETRTGMALMKMEAGLDTGPVLATAEIDIDPEETTGTLFEKMGTAAGSLIKTNLHNIPSGTFIPQDDEKATWAPIIQKEEERLDLNQDDAAIHNQIRALSPTPGAWMIANGKKFKILKATLQAGKKADLHTFFTPGKGQLGLQLKDHWLNLEQVQMEGKPAMDIRTFTNGQGRNLPGTRGA